MNNTNSANNAQKAKKARQRAENWTREEKELFLKIMRDSAHIVENKQSDTNSNNRKNMEWLKVQKRLSELTGKWRDVFQLKGFWRRLKLHAKRNISESKNTLRITSEGNSSAPCDDDQTIIQLCPTDVTVEIDPFDSAGFFEHIQIEENESNESENNKIEQSERKNFRIKPHRTECTDIKNFKKTLLLKEHNLKMKYQKLELSHQQIRHKMEIDILLLEKEKKELELSLLKKSLL